FHVTGVQTCALPISAPTPDAPGAPGRTAERGPGGSPRRTDRTRTGRRPPGSLELAQHPGRRVGRQRGQVAQELVDVLPDDGAADVLAQEAMEVRGDALREEPAAAQRRDDEALHRTAAPALRQI